jgi:uncharacterized membrane protein
LFFALAAILIVLHTEKKLGLAIGAFFIGLAVGCRPFYLIMALFYLYHAFKRFPKISTIVYVAAGLIPPGIFYAVYNFVRFGSFFEFGHKYLAWYQAHETTGLLDLKYFTQDLFYSFINPPGWDRAEGFVTFSGMGTGLWFACPVILFSFVYFFKPGIGVVEKLVSGITVFSIWFLLLLHDTNGWFQFGYRFSVDIIPLLLFFFGRAFTKDHWYLVPVSVFSIIVNIYGAFWFYIFNA